MAENVELVARLDCAPTPSRGPDPEGIEVHVADDGMVRIRLGCWDADFVPARARQLATLIASCAEWAERHPPEDTDARR